MSLKSLVMCSDEKIVRLLRRVLSELEIGIDHCSDPESAIRKLTRLRFEAVIVDCTDLKTASTALKTARTAPCNKRAIAVAIMDGHTGLRSAFDMGAHFVLYKPVSPERAKAAFRAARALMKRERRRNSRVPVQVPVHLVNQSHGLKERVVSTDLSEGGIAVQHPKRHGANHRGPWQVKFALPGSTRELELAGQAAWHNPGGQIGIRFVDPPVEISYQLRQWLNSQSPENEKDDPPVRCKLTDLSLGGCYLEVSSPFPARTRILICMRAAGLELRVEGVVRIMHPEVGMGVEFRQTTEEQRDHVEKFIHALRSGDGAIPELMVEPEGLETEAAAPANAPLAGREIDDPLLELFYDKASLSAELFLGELRKQRMSHPMDTAEENILPV
jgi:c-di-GMP-binding flagellar brake protein YcgR